MEEVSLRLFFILKKDILRRNLTITLTSTIKSNFTLSYPNKNYSLKFSFDIFKPNTKLIISKLILPKVKSNIFIIFGKRFREAMWFQRLKVMVVSNGGGGFKCCGCCDFRNGGRCCDFPQLLFQFLFFFFPFFLRFITWEVKEMQIQKNKKDSGCLTGDGLPQETNQQNTLKCLYFCLHMGKAP